jgi:hypothetical protein
VNKERAICEVIGGPLDGGYVIVTPGRGDDLVVELVGPVEPDTAAWLHRQRMDDYVYEQTLARLVWSPTGYGQAPQEGDCHAC